MPQKKAGPSLSGWSAPTSALCHNEEAPLCTCSPPCNSPALTPRGCRLPYMTYLLRTSVPMAAVHHTASPPLWSLPCVYSAVRRGSCPISSKLPPDRFRPLRRAATRRHRTRYPLVGPASAELLYTIYAFPPLVNGGARQKLPKPAKKQDSDAPAVRPCPVFRKETFRCYLIICALTPPGTSVRQRSYPPRRSASRSRRTRSCRCAGTPCARRGPRRSS